MNRLARVYLQMTRRGPQGFFQWLLLVCLVPFGLLYGIVGWLRLRAYRLGLLTTHHSSVPVISVGNLAAGGKGKTPLVDYIVGYYLARGKKVAVVSRGYGGRARARVTRIAEIAVADRPSVCGDEPTLLQQRNPQCEVLIARRRADGIAYAHASLGADVVVLDDGFQHLAAERMLDIVMLDGRQPFANGWPLPAGELREFAPAYRRADVLVLSRCSDQDPLPPHFDGPVLRTVHRLASTACDLTGQTRPLDELRGLRGVAFAGIASPEGFFASLQQAGLNLVAEIPLPDHVAYDQALIERLNRLSAGADFLVTTEKDGVKLSAAKLQLPCYQIPLRLDLLSGETLLIASLEQVIAQGRDMNLTDELLAILACPKCKGEVTLQEDRQGLICPACKLVYPVRDDIPVMLIDEATPI